MLTPSTTDSGIPHRNGNFSSLTDALDYAATGNTGLNFYAADGTLIATLPYSTLRERAIALAGRLAAVYPRLSRIGIVAETSQDFMIAFMACQYCGLVPAPLTLPAAFGGRDVYEWQVARTAETADLAAIMAPDDLKPVLTKAVADQDIAVIALSGADLPDVSVPTVPHGAGDPAYIQFSSGSTSAPKGIYATQASVSANCHAIINEALHMDETDRCVSWLPLYHDMGLVGFFMVPLYCQTSVDYISPTSFARRPTTWLKLISENRGTIVYSPSFGYDLCARRYRGEELDLSSLRTAGIGGDMVRDDAMMAFCDTFGASGFKSTALVPSYGLAETTLGVAFAPLGVGLRRDKVDTGRMQTSGRAVPASHASKPNQIRTFVSCGKPMASLELRIVDESGENLEDRRIGRIILRGPSVAAGYFRAEEESLTPLIGEDGWLETGDLGYWLDGEVVITGRSKDLILWNGRNIWPQDIEWVAQNTGGKNISGAGAFEISETDGGTRIVLLAECWSRDEAVREQLVHDISAATRATTGAPVSVELVGVRSLPMTSSGKLSRAGARARYLAGGYNVAPVEEQVSATAPVRGA
ncbi:MAG: fatty acyl-AMP ligase [Roseovarius sp.]|nr:fatty acyl-AMP ligase [Roseovarius sp.]